MNIIKYPDERLRTVCKEVKKINNKIRRESKQILDSLKLSETPFVFLTGLAANQIGIENRIIVLKRWKDSYITMINPKIVSSSIPSLSIEVCASLSKTLRFKIRKFFLKVQYQDLDSKQRFINLFGFIAFTMQQELDHLDGKLIID